ncbi:MULTISPECIES: DEAD/DEAH box helicase [Corynebacterium]|nr:MULTISPECIES: DEAD/DEAH box helicase [Corynebacterium]MDN8623560.1 DEAD/DEAH box helicase [Corynebacterium kroppenstedtii]QRQ64571.1 DEAD/DEAH box helicase [Corynebacterium kroppenstedtii]
MKLREWQQAALSQYFDTNPDDFLAVATPGAGKTTFALTLARRLLDRRAVNRIIVVVPTEHLKHQWADAASRMGIALDANFTNSAGTLNPVFDGMVVTYAQVSMHPFKHNSLATTKKSLVIMDEIHHGGDAKSWGDGIRYAYSDSARRLELTGTPFRSDDAPIPFVRYIEDGDGHQVSRADYTYGYSHALRDGVVRPVVFMAYSGEARWRDSAGEEFAARLGEPLSAEHTAKAWKTALDPKGQWIPSVLRAADIRLKEYRRAIPDAGGLVIATDTKAARAYAKILERLSGEPVTVVLSDEPGSSRKIEEFSQSTERWLVAVRMVSEGVDVPRLAVGVYATSSSTPLFFAQAVGRFVRARVPGETASIFLPSIPVLLDLASQMEAERNHVLGKPHRPNEGWDDELVAQANRTESEPDDLKKYESLGADAELDHLIYDGSSYGTGTLSGSEEEAEYLGLPGLLNADQMRQLLQNHQQEQLKAREREKKKADEARRRFHDPRDNEVGSDNRHMSDGSRGVIDDLPRLRKELNALVSISAARTGRPHGQVHNEVRQACGGPQTALCTADQLRSRINYLRKW